MATRSVIQPVNLNASALAAAMATFPSAPSAGIDAAGSGTAFATPWAGFGGVEFINNGNMILWVYNGVTASVSAYHLVGQKAAGQVLPYTTYTTTIGTSVSGWLGPWSVQQFTQTDGAQFATGSGGASPGGAINASTPSGVGYCCIDFNTTTTLAVRLYQLIPATP